MLRRSDKANAGQECVSCPFCGAKVGGGAVEASPEPVPARPTLFDILTSLGTATRTYDGADGEPYTRQLLVSPEGGWIVDEEGKAAEINIADLIADWEVLR